MKRIICFGLCIIVLLFSLSCGNSNDVVFFAEKFWWNVIAQENNLFQNLESICQENGFNLKLIIVDREESYAERLKQAALSTRAKLIITGPMFAYDVDALAAELSHKLFIVIGASDYYQFSSSNVLAVVFNRQLVYYRAGQIISSLLSPDYYYMYEALQEKKVGIIYSLETDKAREYVDKFKQGFLEEQQGDRIIIEAPENVNDRVQALRSVESLGAQEVKIFLLKNYSLIPACVQKITAMDAYYIIEDWKYLKEYAAHLLFSIEEDIPYAVNTALQCVELKNGEVNISNFKRISIPCRLYWGKALLPPSEFLNEITLWETETE